MPWSVRKSDQCPADKPYAVVKDGTGEVEGCHASTDKARKQQAALYRSESAMAKMYAIFKARRRKF